MKNNLTKRSLCIALVVVMMLGLSVINASACSHSSYYWELEEPLFDYFEQDELVHGVCKSDVANCKLCGDIFTYCTHWYSESHLSDSRVLYTYLVYWGEQAVRVTVWERTCIHCGYSYVYEEI